MNADQKVFLFKTLEKYTVVSDEEKEKLERMVHVKDIGRNSFFVRQGESQSDIALILTGIFRVSCLDFSGSEKTLAFRTGGQFLCTYSPAIEKREVWYSIESLADSSLLFITRADYKELIMHHSCWDILIKNYIIQLYIEKEDRERSFLLDDAAERYRRFTGKYPGIEQHIPQYYIASYLGISPVSLSRIRARLK
jgi:CRP-like cAMP-binding protein